MDARIKEALEMRTFLSKYLKIEKEIYDDVEISINVGNCRIDERFWEKWRELAQKFKIAKNAEDIQLPKLVKETKDEFRPILKDTIIKILAEVLMIGFEIKSMEIFRGGIRFCSVIPCNGTMDYLRKYKIPEDILNILDTDEQYSIWLGDCKTSVWSYDIISEVFQEIAFENRVQHVLEFKKEDGSLYIYLPPTSEIKVR